MLSRTETADSSDVATPGGSTWAPAGSLMVVCVGTTRARGWLRRLRPAPSPDGVESAMTRGSGYWNQTSRNSISPRTALGSNTLASGRSWIAGTMSRYSNRRRKRASEVWTSMVTRMSCTSGIWRRDWSVVNAMIVPAVSNGLLVESR